MLKEIEIAGFKTLAQPTKIKLEPVSVASMDVAAVAAQSESFRYFVKQLSSSQRKLNS